MHILFGENGQALANAAAVPDWFFEGDAVYNETLLSEQGRGRLPLFLNGYKALYLQQKHYSYMKLRNGSYKNYVPNHFWKACLFVFRNIYASSKSHIHRPSFFRKIMRPNML
jgi:hypothetical protein